MRQPIASLSTSKKQRNPRDERGVALITTLLLLMLLTAVSVVMVLSTSSDMLINGYYRNFRSSFYAADSGLNIARQSIYTKLTSSVPASFAITTQPIPTGSNATVASFLTSTYGGSFQTLDAGLGASSWPASFKLTTATINPPTCSVFGATPVPPATTATCTSFTGTPTSYNYTYTYDLVAVGQSRGTESTTLEDKGSMIINAVVNPVGSTTKTLSFAAWGMFIDQSPICNGSTLVPGTISGPVFTNGAWNFGATTSSNPYIFTDAVGSANADAGYQFSSQCDSKPAPATSDKNGSTTIAPTFQNGLNLAQGHITPPANSFNQAQAVLDGVGNCTGTCPAHSAMNLTLKDGSGNPYPASGTPASGVFLPYSSTTSGGVTTNTFTGGGIYVQGDAASVVISPGSTATQQVYTITQGSGTSAVTTAVTVDSGTNTTTMATTTQVAHPGSGRHPVTTYTSSTTTTTIVGVPENLVTTTSSPATMLYVNGAIDSLSGPSEGQAAIQNGTALTITAASDVDITGDILYKEEPVTQTGTPPDALIPGNNFGQVLGIFTAGGNINLENSQSDGNLEIDASIAAISAGGSGGLVNPGSAINQLTIVGGRIQSTIQNINTTTRNVFFDRRFQNGNFAPPWFPSSQVTTSSPNTDTATVTGTFQRTQWINQTSTF